jgi:hypothetical protein
MSGLFLLGTLKAVQLCHQGEGSALVVPQGRALPPAGQCGHYSATLPGQPQPQLSEQGELWGRHVVREKPVVQPSKKYTKY